MKYKHIVFDWDGTLADTYTVICDAYAHVFNSLNIAQIPYEEIKEITSSLQNKDVLTHVFGNKKEQASIIFDDYIKQNHLNKLKAIKNAKELLDYCKQNNYKTYLITNKRKNFVLKEIKKLGFEKYFSKIVAAGEYLQDKPSHIATHQLFDNQLPPASSILVIGDGKADVQTTKTYNHSNQLANCVLYNPNAKSNIIADYEVKDLIDIIPILEKK